MVGALNAFDLVGLATACWLARRVVLTVTLSLLLPQRPFLLLSSVSVAVCVLFHLRSLRVRLSLPLSQSLSQSPRLVPSLSTFGCLILCEPTVRQLYLFPIGPSQTLEGLKTRLGRLTTRKTHYRFFARRAADCKLATGGSQISGNAAMLPKFID